MKEAEANNPHCNVEVQSFYNDNVYYLIVYKVYTDVRFVGAPPSSIGKFGADTDNWMWPRHTGDFSMFRVYADKDNNPADYSPENVPLKAKNHLKISLAGVPLQNMYEEQRALKSKLNNMEETKERIVQGKQYVTRRRELSLD